MVAAHDQHPAPSFASECRWRVTLTVNVPHDGGWRTVVLRVPAPAAAGALDTAWEVCAKAGATEVRDQVAEAI